jgi:DNA-binding MarR family transcriptional regulator
MLNSDVLHIGVPIRLLDPALVVAHVETSIVATSKIRIVPGNEKSRRKRAPALLEEAVYLELLRTTDVLSHGLAKVLKTASLSSTQYNVLRILRGTPDGLPCGEIANRMITRDPDITRLLDRLEKRGLISRWRDSQDRRMVFARITADGLHELARLDVIVLQAHRRQLSHLGRKRLLTLGRLLRDCRLQEKSSH